MSISIKVWLTALIAVAGFGSLCAAEEGGTVTGVVASKGDTWLGVKAEGQEEPSLFMPYWKGTGFDSEMLGMIKGVAVGSKVKVVWKQDEHPRIVSLETLAAPEKPHVAEKHGERGAGEKERMIERGGGLGAEREKERMVEKERMMAEREKERMAEKERMMAEKERMMAEREKGRGHGGEKGTAIGIVMSKGEGYIEVKSPEKDAVAEKYFPRYVGKGGDLGMDREMVRTFGKLKVGEWVKIEWIMDERRRAVKLDRAPQ